jgi:hypothetical protein
MKKAMAAMIILAGTLCASPRVSVELGFGAPAPVAAIQPPCPGPGYNWVAGYYAPNGFWIPGYWAPPVAVQIAPRYEHARAFDHHVDDHHFNRHDDHFRR